MLQTAFDRNRRSRGFTLIEVLLATAIATGLLLAAILFYQQTADLRGQILAQGDRYAQIRLVMDRLVADLRTARPRPGDENAFSGNGTAIQFYRTAWTGSVPGGAAGIGASDLTQVKIFAVQSLDGTNTVVTGIQRVDGPAGIGQRESMAQPLADTSVTGFHAVSTNLNPGETRPQLSGLPQGSSGRRADVLSDVIRYVQFRYWDGQVWVDGWTNSSPPPGVEISLSCEPAVEGTNSGEYATEMFRRVLFIPGGEALRKPELDGRGSSLTP